MTHEGTKEAMITVYRVIKQLYCYRDIMITGSKASYMLIEKLCIDEL